MKRSAGLTLTELLVSIMIIAVLAAIAVPSFTGMLAGNRLKGAANQLYTDLHFAKSESVRRNANIFFRAATGSSWSYAIGTNSACSCTGSACSNCDLKTLSSSDYSGISIASSTFGSGISFSSIQARPSAGGSVTFQNSEGVQLRVLLNLVGRPRICGPSGATLGYPSC